jgi:tetratricopeptide (TPR) repeat protein
LSATIIDDIGRTLARLGRFDEALVQFKKAIEVDPTYAWGFSSIAEHYQFVSGEFDKAVVWFRKSVSVDPGTDMYPAWLTWAYLDLGDLDGAEYWAARSVELGPESARSNLAMHTLHLYRGDEAALDYAPRRAFQLNQLFVPFLPRDHEVRAGRYTEARALYEEFFPELLSERNPKVDPRNYRAAIDLALILSRTGEQGRADWLLDRSLQQIQKSPRLGDNGYGFADVQLYALRGEKQKALLALRQAIDEGWRAYWWYSLKHKPDLDSIRDTPEFSAIVAEIEADMAAQLARVREMERNGELAAIPRGQASLH